MLARPAARPSPKSCNSSPPSTPACALPQTPKCLLHFFRVCELELNERPIPQRSWIPAGAALAAAAALVVAVVFVRGFGRGAAETNPQMIAAAHNESPAVIQPSTQTAAPSRNDECACQKQVMCGPSKLQSVAEIDRDYSVNSRRTETGHGCFARQCSAGQGRSRRLARRETNGNFGGAAGFTACHLPHRSEATRGCKYRVGITE